MKPNDTGTLPETGADSPGGTRRQPKEAGTMAAVEHLRALADDLQDAADEAMLDYQHDTALTTMERSETYADAAAMARRHLADLGEHTEDDPDHDDQQSQEDDRPAARSVRLSDVYRVTGALIDTLEMLAQANRQQWEDYGDEQARGGEAAYRDSAKQARTTQMDLLAAATHPEADILASIAEDLTTMADEARDDAKESGNLLTEARSEALDDAATLVREHLTDLEDPTEGDTTSAHPIDVAAEPDGYQRFTQLMDRLTIATGSPGLTAFHDGKVRMTLDEWERLIGAIETGREDRQEESDPAPTPAQHPLDAAIQQASRGVLWGNVISVPVERLYADIARATARTGHTYTTPDQRVDHLEETAIYSRAMLLLLGVGDPWQAMRDEYDCAKEKHGNMTLDNPATPDTIKYYALMEEVGEVARCLTYDAEHAGDLTTEITQVGALALAWLATPPPAAEEQ